MSTLIDCPSCGRKLRVPNDFLGKSVRCPTCAETFRAPESVVPPAAPEPAPAASPEEPAPALNVALKLELDDEPAAGPPPAPPPPRESPRRTEDEKPRRRRERDLEDDDEDDRPRRRRRGEFEPCPRCREDIRRGAVVCPYCGLDLEIQGDGYTRQKRVRMDAEPHRGGMIQALGIASLIMAVIWFLFWIGLPMGVAAWAMGRRDLRKMDNGEMDPNGRKKTKDGWLCGMIGAILSAAVGLVALGIISMIILDTSQPHNNPQPPPNFGQQKAWQPPAQQRPQARVNNFSLRAAAQAPLTLRPGQTKSVGVTVDRAANFRGIVVVKAEADDDDDITVTPEEVSVPPNQTVATFQVKAEKDAAEGVKTVHVSATSNAGDEVLLDLKITVNRAAR
jgi:hypothetical protein